MFEKQHKNKNKIDPKQPLEDVMVFYCDNLAIICFVNNPVFHEMIKYVKVDCHFIEDVMVLKNNIEWNLNIYVILFIHLGTAEPLSWAIRIKVALGAARGLSFLHNSESQVIYRDVKASNILLDSVGFVASVQIILLSADHLQSIHIGCWFV